METDDLPPRGVFLDEVEASLGRGDCETALALSEARLSRLPGDPDARIVLCRVRVRQGRLDEAWDMLEELEETLVSLSRVYAIMGDICVKKGMQDTAQLYYGKFAGLNPDVPPFAAETAGEPPECGPSPRKESAEEAEEGMPAPSGFQTVTLAELYIRQGHHEQAARVLEEILKNDPGQEKAAGMLRELQAAVRQELPSGPPHDEEVVGRLSRWLNNIQRLRDHAA